MQPGEPRKRIEWIQVLLCKVDAEFVVSFICVKKREDITLFLPMCVLPPTDFNFLAEGD
jgi:hypothetical protein